MYLNNIEIIFIIIGIIVGAGSVITSFVAYNKEMKAAEDKGNNNVRNKNDL